MFQLTYSRHFRLFNCRKFDPPDSNFREIFTVISIRSQSIYHSNMKSVQQFPGLTNHGKEPKHQNPKLAPTTAPCWCGILHPHVVNQVPSEFSHRLSTALLTLSQCYFVLICQPVGDIILLFFLTQEVFHVVPPTPPSMNFDVISLHPKPERFCVICYSSPLNCNADFFVLTLASACPNSTIFSTDWLQHILSGLKKVRVGAVEISRRNFDS